MKRCSKCNKLKCKCSKDHVTSPSEQTSEYCVESSFNCPEKIPTRVFASPNSALPEDQLNELQLCIEEANNLLRTLGSQSNPENTRQLQLHLLDLKGLHVSVKIKCNFKEGKRKNTQRAIKKHPIDSIEEKKGVLGTTGRDFIQLDTECGCIFILFERLISLSQLDDYHQDDEQNNLELILNKELVLNFGEFVSKRPKLVNLFFGIPLHMQLQKYIGENVEVKTDKHIVSGTLLSVDENDLQIKNSRKKRKINLTDICFIEIQ